MKRILIPFTSIALVLVAGCGQQYEQSGAYEEEFSFDIQWTDERGEIVEFISYDASDNSESKTVVGAFGTRFHPIHSAGQQKLNFPNLEEEESSVDHHEIYLHVGESSNQELEYISMNFSFPSMQKWKQGEYKQTEFDSDIKEESRLNYWQLRREYRKGAFQFNSNEFRGLFEFGSGVELNINMLSAGYGGNSNQMIYHANSGSLTIDKVRDDLLIGEFSAKMTGLPEYIFDKSKMPDNPEFREYQVSGTFKVSAGTYEDLTDIRVDLRNIHNYMNHIHSLVPDNEND